jgi:choline dehydrogenase-like flavoprotein
MQHSESREPRVEKLTQRAAVASGPMTASHERPAPPPMVDASPAYLRSVLAVAEAILPGSAHVPAADEATVARAEEVIRTFDPRALTMWRGAIRALDLAAVAKKGRPLHALSGDEQESLLRAWEADPVLRTPLALVGLVLKMVHFDRPAVYGRMGGQLNVVSGLEKARWLSQVHRASEWAGEDEVECEVVVIGTGAGGAVVGRELAERGYAVLFVEEGEHYRRDDFDGSSVRAHQRFYRAAFSVGNVVMPVFAGRLVGGSTAINGGTCYRTPDWVLDKWCESIGTDELSPSAMDRYFSRVESIIGVEAANLPEVGPIAQLIARAADKLGWHHAPIARNAPGCTGAGFCDFGCRTDARRSTNLSYIPPALERNGMMFTGLRAERIMIENGRAVGVEGIAKNGRRIRVRARAVVFSGGAIPTPIFLQRQGLANASGQVGRNLVLQPSAGFAAQFDEPLRGHKYIPQGYKVDQFLREGQLLMTAQADVNVAPMTFPFSGHKLMNVLERHEYLGEFALLIADATANGRVYREVGGYPVIRYDVTQADADRMHQLMVRAAELCLAAGAKTLYPVTLKHNTLQNEADFLRFRNEGLSPSDIVWLSYHPMGTCKMGRDPKTSVVGLDHQAHDVPGLFIVDGSTVPSALGVNPQLTIMAMATRAAHKIAEVLG